MPTRASFQNLADKLINTTFSDFRDPVVLQSTSGFDYDTQEASVTATNNIFGIRLEYSKNEFQGQSIQQGDYKVIIEQQSTSIDVRSDDTLMTFNGKDVEIVNVSEDAARAVYTLQVRDK